MIEYTKKMIEEDILNMCLSMSDDKDFQKDVRESTHRERVEQLELNGFTIPNEAKTWRY